MSDDGDLVLGESEEAFWQAAYVAALSDAVQRARVADEAVRQFRARLPKVSRGILRLQGGPEPAGIDPPKDSE